MGPPLGSEVADVATGIRVPAWTGAPRPSPFPPVKIKLILKTIFHHYVMFEHENKIDFESIDHPFASEASSEGTNLQFDFHFNCNTEDINYMLLVVRRI